jgi:uncharacterized protein (DUF1697 family)
METVILLLRGVNVGGHRKVPMVELRTLCGNIGFANVRTYLASGNVVADVPAPGDASAGKRAGADAANAAKTLEQAIAAHFGFPVDVIARRGQDWRRYLDENPFAAQAETQPNRVMLLLANRAPAPGAVDAIRDRAGAGELVHAVRDGIWIFYAEGAADTRITPAGIDKAVGAPTTSRNWRTVQALSALVDTQ